MKNIISRYNDNNVVVRTDSIGGTTFITTEIPTHDVKFLLLGANNYVSDTFKEAQFEMWICGRSHINDDLITDLDSSCYDIFNCCDFANSSESEQALKALCEDTTLPYFEELKASIHSLMTAMEKYFDFTTAYEIGDDEEYEMNFNVFG